MPEWEKVVSLHPFSTRGGYVEKDMHDNVEEGGRKQERFESDEKTGIACVTFPYGGMGEDTKTSQDRFGGARAMWVYSHCRAEETR